jgi:prepilin-type processing-associated H-X9-DG protein
MPGQWNERNPQGTFDVGGCIPRIDDARVCFVKGWFDNTVPAFLRTYEPQGQLWIHIDADLYGSTLQVLTFLNKYIRPGTVVMFDFTGPFEAGWPDVAGNRDLTTYLPNRHNDGVNVGFIDGHAKWFMPTSLSNKNSNNVMTMWSIESD